ncbi:class I SAM-dependent methyltransferase [Plantactinospora sp. CA-290183]|uniref:class I SAM-dependent methyltransferase n=1 Tax=Plantactinospora sp. CA-290183 TaxID=3240006 RepID=UPI003D8B80E8
MEATEIHKLATLEDTHWWYRERRALLARALRRLAAAGRSPGPALDIGAAGGGNTRVLRAHGWRPVALEYSADGATIAVERGLATIRADARHLPLDSASLDLVVAFDILEHVDEDHLAAAEIRRTLRPGGTALIAVPCDMRLWSAHDVAVGHVRRYDRRTLTEVVEKAGLVVDEVWSWNVLLRPVAAWRRRRSTGSDLDDLPALVNLGLRAVITAERYLPVKSLPGVSLMLRAHRPERH